MPPARRRAWHAVRTTVATAALVAAAVLLVMGLTSGSSTATLPDLDGRPVVVEETPDAEGADLRATGGRFVAPEHALDVPLVEMTVTGGTLNPPTFTDAFVLRDPDRVTPQGTRPLVVALHAVRSGRAPGNAFFEPGSPDPAVLVRPGAEVVVDGATYVVERTEVLGKAQAARSRDIWGALPDGGDRLVVITCLQRSDATGHAVENLVLHAVRA